MARTRSQFIILLVLTLGLAAPGAAVGAPISIANASFEDLALGCASGPNCFVPNVPGWSITAAFSVVSTYKPGAGEFPSVPDGVNVLAIGNQFGGGNASQTLSANLLANTTYTLSVDIGNRLDFPFSLYMVELFAGANLLASSSNTVAPSDGQFVTDTLVFGTGAAPVGLGQALTIRISATGRTATGAAAQSDFDLVRLDAVTAPSGGTPVPEPATLTLVALGGLAAYARRRRRLPSRD